MKTRRGTHATVGEVICPPVALAVPPEQPPLPRGARAATLSELAPYSGRHGHSRLNRDVGDLLAIYERQGRLLAFPVPNGAMLAGSDPTARKIRAHRMKENHELRPGVSDWVVKIKDGPMLVIELKVGRDGLSDEQNAFLCLAKQMGCSTADCRDVGEVERAVAHAEQRVSA